MQKLFVILTLSLFASFLTNCSGDSSATNTPDSSASESDAIPTYTPENFEGVVNELSNARFYCQSTDECPENVGLVFVNMDGKEQFPKIGQCTGFLIADNIFATNSHCVPDRLKIENSNCKNQIGIRFIVNGFGKQVFGCQEIISYSDLSVFGADYAFIKIKRNRISPLKISKDGLSDNKKILIPKVTPLSYQSGGRLEVEECKIVIGSMLNLTTTTKWSETAVALNCKIEGGNSGSPLLNDKNEVIGLMQSKMLTTHKQLLEDGFKSFGLNLPQKLPLHTIVTNFACIKDPVTQFAETDKCAYARKTNFVDCVSLHNEKTTANKEQLKNNWKQSLPPIFIYTYTYDVKSSSISADPTCVKSRSSVSNYDDYIKSEGILFWSTENIDLEVPTVLHFGSNFSIDEELRMKPEIGYSEKSRHSFGYKLTKENDLWKGTTHSTTDTPFLGINLSTLKINLSLSECSQEQVDAKPIERIKLSDGKIVTAEEYKQMEEESEKESIICEK